MKRAEGQKREKIQGNEVKKMNENIKEFINY